MTRLAGVRLESPALLLGPRGLAKYALELVVVAVGYFVLARVGLALAALHPSAIPIWPPAGFALAAVLLRGSRIWPAIFVAAWAANAPTDMAGAGLGSIASSAAIAAGNTLAALAAGYLINIWSDGCRTFDTPAGVAKFAFVCLGPSTMISATVGVVSLCVAGHADWASFISLWVTWWLRDVVGALVDCAGLRALGDRRCPRLQRGQGLDVRHCTDRGARRWRARLQSADRANRRQERAELPGRRCRCCGRRCAGTSAIPRQPPSFCRASRSGALWPAAARSRGEIRATRSCRWSCSCSARRALVSR